MFDGDITDNFYVYRITDKIKKVVNSDELKNILPVFIQKMSEELNQAISEFEPKKRDIEDILIDGLINYVRNGSLFKVNDSSLYTCYDIIYSFSYIRPK